MTISNKMIYSLAALIVAGIVGHQWVLHRSPPNPAIENPSTSTLEPAVPSEPVIVNDSVYPSQSQPVAGRMIESPAPVSTIAPLEDPVERRRLVNEQARLMYEYAAKAGPDDPFSLTSEEIDAFRQQGDPTLW